MVGQGRKQAEGLGGQTRGLQSSMEDMLVRLGEGRTWSWALQVEGGPQFLAWALRRQLAFRSWTESMMGQGTSPSSAACGPPDPLALSTSVALVLGVTGVWPSSLCHPLVSRTCQELEGSHLSQWENTQGGHLEPDQRALWPQSSGPALSMPGLPAPTFRSQARSQRLNCVPRRPQVRSGSEKGG